ncbi:MAG: dihydroorotate dehydrogenase electron transfer subunit, partial [Gammaproteobacteria bacterium]
MSSTHRATIFVEQAEVLSHTTHPGEQRVLRVHAPRLACAAHPGCFAHIRCDERLDMRRPMSIMRVDAGEGWAEF